MQNPPDTHLTESCNELSSDRLKKMLEHIEKLRDDKPEINIKDSALKWRFSKEKHYIDPLLEKLFENDFDFSERREQEIRVTLSELILNSYGACDERNDLHISFIAYIGNKGIVIIIKDEGPGFDTRAEVEKRKLDAKGLTEEIVLYDRGRDGYPGGTAIYCLLKFTQDFQYNNKGNEITLRFELSK